MGRYLRLSVNETLNELIFNLKKAKSIKKKEKLLVLYWLKSNQVQNSQEIANLLVCDKSTIHRWIRLYREGGLSKLLENN